MGSENAESTGSDVTKSKQERVRDNQRRSRARRREYLAELETQLQQCHITCREADLQRAAFAELQAENARLREALASAGFHPDYPNAPQQGNMPQHHGDPTTAPFRELKPKLLTTEIPILPLTIKQKPVSPTCCPTLPSSTCCAPQPPAPTDRLQVYDNGNSYQLLPPATAPTTTIPVIAHGFPGTSTSYGWSYPSNSEAADAFANYATVCHAFHVPAKGPLWPADSNSISCSVAKDMIEQYNPAPQEMQNIVARLAAAFTRPVVQGENCRVNGHVLFQILSEMNSAHGPEPASRQALHS